MKKIFIICPDFYEYKNKVARSFTYLGFDVDVFSERPSGFIYDFSRSYLPKIKLDLEIKYCNRLLSYLINNDYDYILIIRGEILSSLFMEKLKAAQPRSRIILYQWDSVTNNPNALNISKHFDEVFSFDYKDCFKYGFSYLPLFFVDDFNASKSMSIHNDNISFLGSYHGDRLAKLINYQNDFDRYGKKLIFKLYISRLAYVKNLMKGNVIPLKHVFFRKLNTEQVKKFYSKYSFILELPSSTQSGVPLRFFETISSGKNIVTDSCNLDDAQLSKLKDYVFSVDDYCNGSDFVPVEHSNISEYSISNWVKKIIKYDN